MDQTEIRDLIEKLNYYTKLYDEGHPEIGDQEWDDMYFKLVQLEKESGNYYEDSPTQRVNYQVVNKLNKVEHNHPMLSLDKTKSIDEVSSFLGNSDWIAMLKMDGLTCSLRYLDGKLVSAETRGNGLLGEDVLHNVLQIKNVPKKINYKNELIIDGEIICTYDNFEIFKEEYKNPRNFASGSIRLLDSEECATRRLSFVAWDCINDITENEDYLYKKLIFLETLGFTTVPFVINTRIINGPFITIEETIEGLKEVAEYNGGYPIDGIVFKFDNIKEYNSKGRTDHHFKGGIAYKFYDETFESELENIDYEVSRFGILTPVAVFKPIDIEGSEVSRASLSNYSVMQDTLHGKGWKGQKVYISKRNQIIPKIESAEKDGDGLSKQYFDISVCPYCGSPLELSTENDSTLIICPNQNCDCRIANKIEHFFSKKGLDTKGISKATIEKLLDWGWISSIKDVFELSKHETEWKNKVGFGEKSVLNIMQSINQSCNTDLESVISAAGIPLIGRTVARDIASRVSSYEDFREKIKSNYDFTQWGGYGYEMDQAIKNFDYTELDWVVDKYLIIQKNNDKISLQKLNDLVFCITGNVHIWKNRNEISKIIEENGGKVTGSVSKNTNYLINNDINSTSAKNKKAKDLGIEIITEEQLQQMLG